MSSKNSGCGIILLVGGIAAGLYILVALVIAGFKYSKIIFTFLGFNLFFYLDNLLKINFLNPIVCWGLWGLLIGSIYGVYRAVKKLKLNKILILIPIIIVVFLLILMSELNSPINFAASNLPTPQDNNPAQLKNNPKFITNSATSVYSDISKKRRVLFKLSKGTIVEVTGTGYYDNKNNECYKILYQGSEGFIYSDDLDSLSVISNDIKNNNNENNSSAGNSNTSFSQTNLNTPDGIVSKFIQSLGNRDYSSAYDLMTEKRRGSYSKFSSTKGYGGITSTRIFSCSYIRDLDGQREIIADYESIDPENKSGRFKQYFYLVPDRDSYLITDIKNIDIQWY